MKRGGFTLIEMMIALSISAVMLTAICGTLSGVWLLVRDSATELQAVMHARYIREQLFYNLTDSNGKAMDYGLLSAKSIEFASPSVLTAYHKDKPKDEWNFNFADDKRYSIDVSRKSASDYEYWTGRNSKVPRMYQYVYLKVEDGRSEKPGYVAYYDRLVIPIFGKGEQINGEDEDEKKELMKQEFWLAIGGKR